jgi:hypothetical protein
MICVFLRKKMKPGVIFDAFSSDGGGGFEPASLEAEERGRQFGPGADVIKHFFLRQLRHNMPKCLSLG